MDFFSDFMFWVFAVATVLPALIVLFTRDIVHMAFWLILSLAGFAGLYLHMGAGFLGFTQVVVYIGGILILMLFGIMLTQKVDIPLRERRHWTLILPGVVTGFGVIVGLILLARGVPWNEIPPKDGGFVAREIGADFMSRYVLPFEAVSILLLVAMVGASYLVRRDGERTKGGESPPTEGEGR